MDYEVKIVASSRELTARERVKVKNDNNAIKLDELVTPDSPFVVHITDWAELEIHNEKSDNVDYPLFVLISDGQTYCTGSESLWKSFRSIWDEMADEDEIYDIEISKKESKNYKGKHFLTCSIV